MTDGRGRVPVLSFPVRPGAGPSQRAALGIRPRATSVRHSPVAALFGNSLIREDHPTMVSLRLLWQCDRCGASGDLILEPIDRMIAAAVIAYAHDTHPVAEGNS